MGSLERFDLGKIIRAYDTAFLFETGTLWGDGVAHAMQFPFEKILSAEIVPEIAEQARKRFEGDRQVEIIATDSITALKKHLPLLKKNIVFWLDAHFPGADAGLNEYDQHGNEQLRLPLHAEVELISQLRTGYNDVLILDDMRIYEDGPFMNGNAPKDALPKKLRSLDFVENSFGKTHVIVKSYLDEGYVLLFPKKRHNRLHSKFFNLFRKEVITDDLFLLEPETAFMPLSQV